MYICSVTNRTANHIRKTLRRASLASPERLACKNEGKVDKALFSCESCKYYYYEGKSQNNLKLLKKKYPRKVRQGKIQIDHIDPVVPLNKKTADLSWNEFIERLFCDRNNLQRLCEKCHTKKSTQENKSR